MSPATDGLPAGVLLAYYGDDFTGSTDVLDAMTSAGLDTVLFLEPPTPDALARFPRARCIGLAGSSRGRDPGWMDGELPASFDRLAGLGAPLLQYKVCSTFDSSPSIGSIGRAIDLGVARMPGAWSPCIVGAPRLGRYLAFGNLFAAAGAEVHRLDRHPTMSRHPVTPMGEADLRRHLSRQTDRRIELVDLVQLRRGDAAPLRLSAPGDVPVVFIDVVDDDTLVEAGRLVWEHRGAGLFSASSSGLEYALTAYWRRQRWIAGPTGLPYPEPVPVVAGVSGSCSPVTAAQLRWARAHGFRIERLDIARALDPDSGAAEIERAVRVAVDALRAGTSAIVHSAEGPDDPAVLRFGEIAAAAGLGRADAARRIGESLAHVMRSILDRIRLQRVIVAGGDSSGEVASALGILALTAKAAIAPGAPLCRAWSADPGRDGLEIVLKGGQMGDESFFGKVRGSVPQQHR